MFLPYKVMEASWMQVPIRFALINHPVPRIYHVQFEFSYRLVGYRLYILS